MNKKEFLKILEEKLSILDENELKDIIDEYKNKIEEKVKHGKSEIEAVKDFGDIDELAKEILKAYKINPKYTEKNKNVKEVIDDCDSLIKRGAKKMANFTKEVYNDFKKNNNDLTVELIFEILIKVLILLVIFALLRLPFELINALGRGILDIAFYPLDEVLMALWEVIIFLLYGVCCVLISIAMFKNYFNNSNNDKTSKKKVGSKKEVKEISKKAENKESKDSTVNVIGKILKVIFQIFTVTCLLVPLWFVNIGIVVAIILSIYYLCLGINTIGILLCTIGLFILFSHISSIFNSIAFNHKKIHFYPFLISLILIVVGFLLTLHTVFEIEYIQTIPSNNFEVNKIEYEFDVNKDTKIYAHNIEYIVDNTVENGKVKIEVEHYNDLTNVNYYKETHNEEYDYINIYIIDNLNYNSGWKVYNLIIDNLKDDKIYKYDLLYNSNTKVYASEKTMNLIKKD